MTWHAKAKGGYSRSSDEAIDNANEIYSILYNLGWTVNSISGLLGNIGSESGYNPFRWQNDSLGKVNGYPWKNKGYGLTQFTPASKYISSPYAKQQLGYAPNYADKSGLPSDGYAQMNFLNYYADYYSTSTYPESYEEFKSSEESPAYLASVWLYNYERPADPQSTESARRENAEYWYAYLTGEDPPLPPIPPSPPILTYTSKPIKPWLLAKRYYGLK